VHTDNTHNDVPRALWNITHSKSTSKGGGDDERKIKGGRALICTDFICKFVFFFKNLLDFEFLGSTMVNHG